MSLKFERGVSLFFNFFSQNVLRKLKEKVIYTISRFIYEKGQL